MPMANPRPAMGMISWLGRVAMGTCTHRIRFYTSFVRENRDTESLDKHDDKHDDDSGIKNPYPSISGVGVEVDVWFITHSRRL